jgi:hypothetical protein
MGQLLIYGDLHRGPKYKLTDGGYNVQPARGHAEALHHAFIDYGNINRIPIIIDNGDQVNYSPDAAAHARETEKALALCDHFNGLYCHTIGNHTAIAPLQQRGIDLRTRKVEQSHLPGVDIVLLQPDVGMEDGMLSYAYDPDRLAAVLEECDQPYTVIVAHFTVDRLLNGRAMTSKSRAYLFDDSKSVQVRATLRHTAEAGRHILMVPGHEHRFALTRQFGYTTLNLPSASQPDREEKRPGGVCMTVSQERRYDPPVLNFLRFKLDGEPDLSSDAPPAYSVSSVCPEYMGRFGWLDPCPDRDYTALRLMPAPGKPLDFYFPANAPAEISVRQKGRQDPAPFRH